ncbi:MAG: hypothetical protein LBV29_01630 [Azoarcus sp.]|nr:hypothetical protein [Azoarcus sp.]
MLPHEKREPWARSGGATLYFVIDGPESALDQAKTTAGEWRSDKSPPWLAAVKGVIALSLPRIAAQGLHMIFTSRTTRLFSRAMRPAFSVRLCHNMTLCLGLVLLAPLARAQAECAANFHSGPSVIENVRTVVMTSVSLQGMGLTDAVAALKQKGLGEGWILEIENNIHDIGAVTDAKTSYDLYLLGFEQKVGPTSAVPLQPAILVAEKTGSAILAVEVPKGTPEEPIKNYFCTFFDTAGLTGSDNAAKADAEANFTTVNELMAVFHGDASQLQQRGDALVAEARDAAKAAGAAAREQLAAPPSATPSDPADRGAPPPVADRRRVLTPKSTFNLDDMDPTALFEGNSTISGLTCGKVPVPGGSRALPVTNEKITLFPYSPYLKEALDLINDNLDWDDTRVDFDPLAFADNLEGMTNAEGKFQFTRLKPGRYMIVTYFSGSVVTSRDTPNSMIDAAAGVIYHWWEHEDIQTSSSDILYADVTIRQDGDVVDGVVVKPHGKLLPVFDGICKWHLN